jgi:hypothetical protein
MNDPAPPPFFRKGYCPALEQQSRRLGGPESQTVIDLGRVPCPVIIAAQNGAGTVYAIELT